MYRPEPNEVKADLARLKDAAGADHTGGESFARELHRISDHYEWRDYRDDVKSAAEQVVENIKEHDMDPSDATWETCDGYHVYTHDILVVLRQTDNADAYTDDYGELPKDNADAAQAFAAFRRDVEEELDREHPGWSEGFPDDEEE